MAGVARSLGAPVVNVRSAEHLASVVTIVIAWELCWYRFEVDLENEVVRQRGQGYVPGELDSDLPPANASAQENGGMPPPVD